MSRYIYIDFEYRNSQEPYPELVCAAWTESKPGSPINKLWLHHSGKNQEHLKKKILEYVHQGYNFVSYAVTAEARCFEALGINPASCNWIDLYLEFRQLRNCLDKYNYGRYYINNMRMHSVPPDYQHPSENVGRNNMMLRFGLKDAVARMLKINLEGNYKNIMRDLILKNDKYTQEEQDDILEYCSKDIVHLPNLHAALNKGLTENIQFLDRKLEDAQRLRGEFAAYVAIMESNGIPVDREAMTNLRNNIEPAKNELISQLVKQYPFFVKKKKRVRDLQGRWVDTYKNFKQFVEEHPDIDNRTWKLTDSGRYCQDDQYLKGYEAIPEIKAYRETRKIIGQLKWLRVPGEKEDDLFDNIGSDDRMRTFFGIYGTQTARNAPAAKRFIFAMSAWLRCLVRPPVGYAITELDYASQEFAIAAILSKDKNMLKAYNSGDPYLYFAKAAGAVPEKGTKKEYKAERNLFKATTLGLQYGMGARSLSIKLSHDTGKKISEARAEKLINLHKGVYPQYWRWLKRIDNEYTRKQQLMLPCGWALLKDNPHALSVRNFPTQGAGSSVIRRAVRYCMKMNIQVIATLHDSIYILSKEENVKSEAAQVEEMMLEAFNDVLANDPDEGARMRIDTDTHYSDHRWVSEKGKDYYEILKQYLERISTPQDELETMLNTIYK